MVTYKHDVAHGNDASCGPGETSSQLPEQAIDRPWWLIGSSVRGATHIRQGLPNQDNILSHPHGGEEGAGVFELGNRVALAVADGHGSASCFRSQIGSDCAVKVAIAVAKEFLVAQQEIDDLSLVKRVTEERLAREIALKWTRVIDEHHQRFPFTPEELTAVERASGAGARRRVENQPRLAYGTTLLAAMVTQTFAVYLQLGDGDILMVSEAGEVDRPMARDARLFANETTSLSGKDAWRDFRYTFQVFAGERPALILLATDGYANSFASDAGFLQVGRDILALLRSTSIKQIKDDLTTWLNEATAYGSGDDITLGLCYGGDALSAGSTDAEEQPQEETNAAAKETTTAGH